MGGPRGGLGLLFGPGGVREEPKGQEGGQRSIGVLPFGSPREPFGLFPVPCWSPLGARFGSNSGNIISKTCGVRLRSSGGNHVIYDAKRTFGYFQKRMKFAKDKKGGSEACLLSLCRRGCFCNRKVTNLGHPLEDQRRFWHPGSLIVSPRVPAGAH